MYEKIILLDQNNNEIECNIIAKWKNYIAYTNGDKTDDKLDLYVSKYIEENNQIKLIEITDEKEWESINKYLNDYLYEKEDDQYE